MLKMGLNIAQFRGHIPLIEEETVEYFKRWGQSGDAGMGRFPLVSPGLLILTPDFIRCSCIEQDAVQD